MERPEIDPARPRPANVVGLDEVGNGDFEGIEIRAVGEAAGAVKAGLNHVTLPAGTSGAPPHVHSLEEELFYVLAGSGTLTLGADEHRLTAGDIVARPRPAVSRTRSRPGRTASPTWSTEPASPATRSSTRRSARCGCEGSA